MVFNYSDNTTGRIFPSVRKTPPIVSLLEDQTDILIALKILEKALAELVRQILVSIRYHDITYVTLARLTLSRLK